MTRRAPHRGGESRAAARARPRRRPTRSAGNRRDVLSRHARGDGQWRRAPDRLATGAIAPSRRPVSAWAGTDDASRRAYAPGCFKSWERFTTTCARRASDQLYRKSVGPDWLAPHCAAHHLRRKNGPLGFQPQWKQALFPTARRVTVPKAIISPCAMTRTWWLRASAAGTTASSHDLDVKGEAAIPTADDNRPVDRGEVKP